MLYQQPQNILRYTTMIEVRRHYTLTHYRTWTTVTMEGRPALVRPHRQRPLFHTSVNWWQQIAVSHTCLRISLICSLSLVQQPPLPTPPHPTAPRQIMCPAFEMNYFDGFIRPSLYNAHVGGLKQGRSCGGPCPCSMPAACSRQVRQASPVELCTGVRSAPPPHDGQRGPRHSMDSEAQLVTVPSTRA